MVGHRTGILRVAQVEPREITISGGERLRLKLAEVFLLSDMTKFHKGLESYPSHLLEAFLPSISLLFSTF